MLNSVERGGVRPGSVEEEIQKLFVPRALPIIRSARKYGLTVVTGSMGSGKTGYLIPAISNELRASGESVAITDAQEHNEALLRRSIVQGKIAIVDEAIMYPDEHDSRLISILKTVKDSRTHLVAIIPHDRQNPKNSKGFEANWIDNAKKVGCSANAIHLQPFYLPNRSIARRYILEHVGIFQGESKKNILDYVLDTFPYNLRVLDSMWVLKNDSLEQLMDGAIKMCDGYLNNCLSKREIKKVEKKLDRDYINLVRNGKL